MCVEAAFYFVVLLSFLSQGVLSACPANWTDTGGRCLTLFIQAIPFESVLNARSLCQQNDADLASVSDRSDEQIIFDLINSTTTFPRPSHVYIGMSDVVVPGEFAWFDNSSATYNNLSAETLNQHFIPGDRRCVAIFSPDRNWSSNISWQLVPCCFDIYDISAAVCSKPYVAASTSTASDALQSYCIGDCPSGWHKLDSMCYLVTDLTRMVNDTLDARAQCLAKGADLPNIRNQTIDIHLSYLMGIVANRENTSCISVYHGLNNILNPSSYVFLDGTSSGYFPWAQSEPSRSLTPDNKTEACLTATWTEGSDNGTVWRDVSCCTSSSISWLACEKPEDATISVAMTDNVYAVQCIPDENECLSNPCVNNGTCYNGLRFYNCTCPYGYTGINCESEINYCSSAACLNGGTCVRRVGAYTCSCVNGTTGTHCETVVDYCYSSPCYYNGTCRTIAKSFTCTCQAGTTGTRCETNTDECASNPCRNGGTCYDLIARYSCSCAPSYTGIVCETEVTCELLPEELNNATRWNVSDWNWGFGNLVTYCCQPHQKFPDMESCNTLACMSSGWNASLGYCEPHCDILPSIENAMIGNANTAVFNTVNFTCKTGFIFNNNQTSVNTTCMEDGNWTTDLTGVVCELVRCPPLPFWPYQTLDTRNNTYNTTVTFWCDVGYVLFDNTTARTIKCLADGTWTADLPPCQPVFCPQITLLPNVNRNTSGNTYMTYAKYWCDNGLRMLDGSTYRIILCDAGAEWSDTISDCTADRCFPLPYVANATPSATDANFWNTSTLTCINGHRFIVDGAEYRSRVMTCQQNGWWYPILTACEPILCPEVPKAANIVPNTYTRLFETVVTYTCDPGHYIDARTFYNQLQITCLETKQWNDSSIPDCWPIVCPAPLNVTNGTQWAPNPPSTNYSTEINYKCNDGYKFIDGRAQKIVRCNATGQWNETDVSCMKERCDPVNITAHTTPDTTNSTWNTVVTYRCNEGYEWPNNVTTYKISCSPGGNWNPTFTEKNDCQPKICPAVVQKPNATTNYSSDQPPYDTIVNYECDQGFKYSDNSTSKSQRCSASAQWEPASFPECQIINCPALIDVENATRDSNDTYYDKVITYSCLPGYQFPDKTKQKPVICTANETWTSFPPPCEVVFCPPLPYWTSAIFNTTDNNFLSTISYTCNEGSAFKSYRSKPGNQTVLTSTCLSSKQWSPPISDCVALSAINADLIGKAYESPQGVPIGTVACTILCIVLVLVVLLDLTKIFSDLRMLRDNVSAIIQHRKRNKIANNPNM